MKKNSSGRKFNIILSVVALILVVTVGGVATYSWVETNNSLDITMNGTIERVPENSERGYKHQIILDKTKTSPVALSDYLDKVTDMKLSPVSSADGENFFMQNGDKTVKRTGSTSDVSYLTFDFDVKSASGKTALYFEDGKNAEGADDLTNHPKPSFIFKGRSAESKSVRVAVKVGDNAPIILSQTGQSYTALTSTGTETVTPQKFEQYEFGGTKLCDVNTGSYTKIRFTIWIEGTDSNLSSEYTVNGLDMKLMLTTPWTKANTVTFLDRTANSYISNHNGTMYVSNNNGSTWTAMSKNGDNYSAVITDSTASLKFKYTYSSKDYIWDAGAIVGDSAQYSAFDIGISESTTVKAYGKWDVEEVEQINIKSLLMSETPLSIASNALDTHIMISTDGTNYYRTVNNSADSWIVNIDTTYTKLYIQYRTSSGATVTYKWDASEGRTDKETMDTYYLLGIEGGSSKNSTGSWTDDCTINFYDGTVDTITSDNTSIEYIAYVNSTQKKSGTMTKNGVMYTGTIKYSDKIDRVKFIVHRESSSHNDIVYTWDGTGRTLNTDIYYVASSYTEN